MRKISQNIPMLIFLTLIPIFLFLPLRLDITFDNHKGYFRICIIWKLLFFNISLYDRRLLMNRKKKSKKQKKNLRWLFKALRVKEFRIKALIGTGDAAETALLTGSMQIVAALIVPAIRDIFKSFDNEPHFNIAAEFNEKRFLISLYCITQVSLGNIIISYFKHRKYKK